MYHLKTDRANLAERAAEKEKTGPKVPNKTKFQSPNQLSVEEHEPHRAEWFYHFCGFFQLFRKLYETQKDPCGPNMNSEYTFDSESDLAKLGMCDISSYDSCDKSNSEVECVDHNEKGNDANEKNSCSNFGSSNQASLVCETKPRVSDCEWTMSGLLPPKSFQNPPK